MVLVLKKLVKTDAFFWYSDNNILTAPGQFCEEMKKKM